ncbi:hypothetical protein DERF_012131 [Dermatophagoides farinae]|uniref:Uncharacterized protein n=1 Tax=Dermatophagoides farinae TaxID=6954 RepID=A0A922L364_DERFA|nr:hypothetical protein DERF_012131 [Dermatophagoides farinae]
MEEFAFFILIYSQFFILMAQSLNCKQIKSYYDTRWKPEIWLKNQTNLQEFLLDSYSSILMSNKQKDQNTTYVEFILIDFIDNSQFSQIYK